MNDLSIKALLALLLGITLVGLGWGFMWDMFAQTDALVGVCTDDPYTYPNVTRYQCVTIDPDAVWKDVRPLKEQILLGHGGLP